MFALVPCLVPSAAIGAQQPPPEAPPEQPPARGRASIAEFERRLREFVKLRKSAQEVLDRIKGNPNASAEDVARLQAMQSKISEAMSDLVAYMDQPQFTDAQRAEMQKMWEKAMAEDTPSKSAPSGGKM